MSGQISTLWFIRKVDSLKVVETTQAIGFIMLSVSVAYPAHFRLVWCTVRHRKSRVFESCSEHPSSSVL